MRELTRRDALSGVAALGVVALAGCVSEEEENGEDDENGGDEESGDDDGSEGADGGNEGAAILDTTYDTVGVDERSDDYDWAIITREDSAVTIEGMIPASDPHHEAVVESEFEDGTLSVVVDVESTLDDDEAGTLPLGEIEYEARIDLGVSIDTVERVEVEHVGGETHVED